MNLSEEQKAATELGVNLIVNAGAGSGKTTVLTARYLRLVREGGLLPAQIVAITFTKKAAREMRERIAEEMAVLALEEPGLARVREQLISAPIGTIHSFYARVLRGYPVEAKINPGFRVLEDFESALLLREATDIAFREALAEECPSLQMLIEFLGADVLERDRGLRKQIQSMYSNLRNRGYSPAEAGLSHRYRELPSWEQCCDDLRDLAGSEGELSASLGERDRPDLAKDRLALVALAAELPLAPTPSALTALYPKALAVTGLKGGRVKGHKEYIAAGVEKAKDIMSSTLAPMLGDAILALLGRLDRVFTRLKRRAGGLDFNDLQFTMWHLLQQPRVLAALNRSYAVYLVDEFQDTDILQGKIISALTRAGGDTCPGKLFIVGDEKQSIYRFRGAELEVFKAERRRQAAADSGAEKQITINYRSRRPVIGLINSLFSGLLAGQSSYVALQAHRGGEGPGAEFISCSCESEAPAAGEARAMAARIGEMVAGKEKIVGVCQAPRGVEYGDIAILLRSRTHIKEYEHYLRREGIPYIVVGGIGFYEQQEVQDMLNLLRAARYSWDTMSLIAVLRSPAFAIDDDSLLALSLAQKRRGGSLWEQDAVLKGEQRRRLLRAQEVVGELSQGYRCWELPRLLERAYELTQYREAILAGHAGLQRFANLERLMELAERYSAGGYANDFITWVEQAAMGDEEQAQIDSERSNAVRVMTIHASKGLQFPVVFLPVANTKQRSDFGGMLVDEDGGVAFRQAWPCPVWETVKEWERRRQIEEYKRLLYVAITRAEDRLVFIAHPLQKEEQSFNYWLWDFAASNPQHFVFKEGGLGTGTMLFPRSLPDQNSGPAPSSSCFPRLAQVGKGKRKITYFSASQFLLWKHNRQEFDRRYLSRLPYEEIVVPGPENHNRTIGGASLGSLLHEAMEKLGPEKDLPLLLAELIPIYFPDADQAQRRQVIDTALSLLDRYRADPGPPGEFSSSVNEQEFYYRLDDVLFSGSIDRLLFAPDHIALLDYKTNLIPQDGPGSIVEQYAPQLRLYALAVKTIYRQRVRAYLQLLRLPPGAQTIEIDLSEEENLVEELREFVAYCRG